MQKNSIEIEKIANLAKLNLSEQEKKTFSAQLADIINWFERLKEADAAAAVEGEKTKGAPLREDKPEIFKNSEDILSNAPQREGGFIKTKKVIHSE